MNIKLLSTLLLGSATILAANAHSIALEENFNGSYQTNFPLSLELDHLPPLNNVRPLFTDNDGVAQPWWKIKDSSASQDGFLSSHSAYLTPGQSNDWIVSRPIEIPTEGYVLTFGAQSYVMRQGDRLSDLRVYVSETPIDADHLPSEPTMLIEKVSEGNYPEDIENDFTEYSLNLDAYAGKTIWLAFANLNMDKDLLVIDNVLIQRLDLADIKASSEEYVAGGEYKVKGFIEASTDEDVKNWKVTFRSGTGDLQTVTGELLKAGEPIEFEFTSVVAADELASWTVELTADGIQPVAADGAVQGLAFIPYHKVLLEEATGTWCGNCPIGMYAMEQMLLSPEMSDYVVPVSVHIPGSGRPDYMENENYAYLFAVQSAPALRIDRSLNVTYFSTTHDAVPADPENPLSVAHAVRERHREISLLDIAAEASLNVAGSDTTSVSVRVDVTPAMTLPSSRYALGFILTENNVGLNSPYWMQENYTSGVTMVSDLDGLTKMPAKISNWRFQDVAREVYGYRGYEGVDFPETLAMNNPYSFETELAIPDTYKELTSNGNVTVVAPSVVAANLTLVAYLLDKEDSYRVVNCVAVPLTEQAEERLTIAEQYERWLEGSGVENAFADEDAEPVYYNLAGIRVDNPTEGIYIVRKGTKVEKIHFHNN